MSLKFYPASHRYRLDGQWVPGVTTIIGVLDKPALKKWAADTVAAWVVDHATVTDTIRDLGGREPTYQFLRAIPFQKRDDAAARGTELHDYAERLLNGQTVDVPEDHVPVMESALAFLDDWQIEPALVEGCVASREHSWAGKFDLIARYTRPDTGATGLGIFDWKSGKGLYSEYAWQLNAYAHAEFHGENGYESPLPECDAAFGVKIAADGYTVVPFAFGPHIYAEFVAIRQVYEIAKRGRGNWKIPGTGHVGAPIGKEVTA